MNTYSESYWKRREEADEEREETPFVESAEGARISAPEQIDSSAWMDSEKADAPAPSAPELDVAESTPASMPAVDTPSATQADALAMSAPPVAAPPAAAPKADDDGLKAVRMRAIREMQRMADAPAPRDDHNEADITAAFGRDRDAVRRANLSETIRAAFARQAPRLQQEPSEADMLTRQQQLGRRRGADRESAFSLNERLANALKEPKSTAPGGPSIYQQFEMDRQTRLDKEKTERAAAEAAAKARAAQDKAAAEEGALKNSREAFAKELRSLGIDPNKAGQKDIDRAISLRHAMAGESVAKSNYAIAAAREGRAAGEHAALGESIPFAGGELKYSGSGPPREDDRKKAQDIAGGWNAALSGMDDLEGSLRTFATNPGVDSKREVESKVRVVSAALNAAIGGGAMSEAEALAMANALGANVVSPSGIEAALNHMVGDDPKAAQVLLTRLQSVRKSSLTTALGKLKTYRYGLGGGSGGSGPVKMRFPDGSTHDVPREKLDKAKAKGGVQVDG